MYKLKSLESFALRDVRVFSVPCPVVAARDGPELGEKIGPVIEIDGAVHKVLGIERHLPNWPMRVGETIGIRVPLTSEAPYESQPEQGD